MHFFSAASSFFFKPSLSHVENSFALWSPLRDAFLLRSIFLFLQTFTFACGELLPGFFLACFFSLVESCLVLAQTLFVSLLLAKFFAVIAESLSILECFVHFALLCAFRVCLVALTLGFAL